MVHCCSRGSVTSSMTLALRKSKFNSMDFSAHVEGESAYLAFHFSVYGFVGVIFGVSGRKLDNVFPGFQFSGEFADIIACWRYGLTGSMREDDEVGGEQQDNFGG